jgi:ABC-type transport system substrate-binding protein
MKSKRMKVFVALVLVCSLVTSVFLMACAKEEVLPTITSINPNQGQPGETLDVTITGTNFTGATSVSFGAGVLVNSFTVDISTQITADITIAADATTGARDILVTTAEGTGILASGFGVGEAPPAKPEGTLRVALDSIGAAMNFLPWVQGSTQIAYVLGMIGDLLIYVDHETLEPIPGLAESWEISQDNYSVTFHLREGVQFHDGWGEMTSADVKFTFDKCIESPVYAVPVTLRGLVDRTETPGPYEFTVYCKEPFAQLVVSSLATLHGFWMTICCKAYIDSVGEQEAGLHPIGTGPYKLVEATLGDKIVLEAVDEHWRVVPEFKWAIFTEVPEEMTRVAMIKRGEVDIAPVSTTSADTLEGQGWDIVECPPEAYDEIFWMYGQYPSDLPTYDPDLPFLKKKVREAMNLAINRQEIADTIFHGHAVPVGLPDSTTFSDEYEPYPYNPDQARELLEEAGYANGFEFELWNAQYMGQAPEMSELVLALAGYWEAIGLTPNVYTYSLTQKYYDMMQRKVVGVVWGESRIASYEPWYSRIQTYYSSSAVIISYYNPEIDTLLAQIQTLPTLEERYVLVRECYDIMYDEYATIPICSADRLWVVSIPHSMSLLNFEYITHSPPLGTFRLPF